MCGILGVFNPGGLAGEVRDPGLFQRMLATLHHRGPDEAAIVECADAILGHTRLNILDFAGGKQPMLSRDRTACLVFNGQIFNYAELRSRLSHRPFAGTGDTEVLLHSLGEWGVDAIRRLNGDFAFGYLDLRARRLLLARDRVGVRPLFYTMAGGTLLFASNIRSLLISPFVRRGFNARSFKQLMYFWTAGERQTFFEDIHSLAPGEYLEFDASGLRRKRYWDLTFPADPETAGGTHEWSARVRAALERSVRLRLQADVPVNAYLSGGLDSSIVLGLASRIHGGPLEAYSVGFDDPEYDESAYQHTVAEHFGLKRVAIRVTPCMIADAFRETVVQAEQPIFRTAPVPMFYLSGLVRDHGTKVVLTGEGADEIAWGYDIFKETLIRTHLSRDPDDQRWLARITNLYPYLTQFGRRYDALMREFYRRSVSGPPTPFFSHDIRIRNGARLTSFLSPDFAAALGGPDDVAELGPDVPDDFDRFSPLQKAQYVEMKTLLAGYLLSSQGDRVSMAHSVEGRYPFLDHDVIELFARIPEHLKLADMEEKVILKHAFSDLLPPDILNRKKQPYRAPESTSLLAKPELVESLAAPRLRRFGMFDPETVARLRAKLERARPGEFSFNENFAFVVILATQVFMEAFFDGGLTKLAVPPLPRVGRDIIAGGA